MYLGIKAVIAKSFARIHMANLINFGILPLMFADPADYDNIAEEDVLQIADLDKLAVGAPLTVKNLTSGKSFPANHALSALDIELLKAGGKLNYIKNKHA